MCKKLNYISVYKLEKYYIGESIYLIEILDEIEFEDFN